MVAIDSGPKAAGCLITVYDIPRILATLSVLGAQLGEGSCNVTLGVSIPFLAAKLAMGTGDVGRLFIVAGVSYFLGTLLSAKYLEITNNNTLSKTLLGALSICVSGIGQLVAVWSDSFAVIAAMVLITFAGMGAMDNFTTIALSEMWGQRVQPWMQTKATAYSCGSMVPMVLIQGHSINYTASFAAFLCFSSLFGIIAEFLLFSIQCSCHEPSSLSKSNNIDSESTELTSMIRSRNTSTCSEHSQITNYTTTEAVYRRTIDKQSKRSHQALSDISPAQTMNRGETRERGASTAQLINQVVSPIINHEEILSTELALLGQVLAAEISHDENHDEEALNPISHSHSFMNGNYQGNKSGDVSQHTDDDDDEDIVRNVLDATEYCQVSEENRADPLFEPHINRTLSFIPEDIKTRLQLLEQRELSEQHHLTNDKPNHHFKRPAIVLLPVSVRLCIACVIFLQTGLSSSMSSWLPVYVTMNGIGTGDSREGGYVGSLYYLALAIGALSSIPMSVMLSTTTLMRFHVFLVCLGVCLIGVSASLFVGVPSISLTLLCGGCMIMGFGMSIIISLSMTVVNDYGLTMDPSAVATGIMGGAIGSALIPTLVGYIVVDAPNNGFWVCILFLGFMLGAFYGALHLILSRLQKNIQESRNTTIHTAKLVPKRSSRSSSYGCHEEMSDAVMNSYQKARKRTLSTIVDE